jgi:hypothetical protein
MQEQHFHFGVVAHPFGPYPKSAFGGSDGDHLYAAGKLIIPCGKI